MLMQAITVGFGRKYTYGKNRFKTQFRENIIYFIKMPITAKKLDVKFA